MIGLVIGLWAIAIFGALVYLFAAIATVAVAEPRRLDSSDVRFLDGARVWVPLLVLLGPLALAWLAGRGIGWLAPLLWRLGRGDYR